MYKNILNIVIRSPKNAFFYKKMQLFRDHIPHFRARSLKKHTRRLCWHDSDARNAHGTNSFREPPPPAGPQTGKKIKDTCYAGLPISE